MKVLIKSGPASFRRAGLRFTREGVEVDSEDLTEEQRKAITEEPNLSVSPGGEEALAEAGGDGKGSKASNAKGGAKK